MQFRFVYNRSISNLIAKVTIFWFCFLFWVRKLHLFQNKFKNNIISINFWIKFLFVVKMNEKQNKLFAIWFLGEQRFSIPVCRKWQGEGELCRPEPIKLKDMPFRYPDGFEINVTRAYSGICPCEPGLTCDRKNGVCV